MKQLIAYTENDKWGYRDKETNEFWTEWGSIWYRYN